MKLKLLKKLKPGKMKYFNKLGFKIGVGFALLIIFSMFLFLISYTGFNTIEKETIVSSNMSQFVIDMKDTNQEQKEFVLTNLKQDEEKVKEDINGLLSYGEELLASADGENGTEVSSLIDYINEYQNSFSEFVQLSYNINDERQRFNELKEEMLLQINQLAKYQMIYIDSLISNEEGLSNIRSQNNIYDLISSLKDTIYMITISEREFLLNLENADEQEKYITQTQNNVGKAKSILSKLSLLIRRPEEKERLSKVKESLAKTEKIFEGIVGYELARDEQTPVMAENMNNAIEIAQNLQQQALSSVKEVQLQAVNRLLTSGIILLLIASILSFIITRRITIPVNQAVELANNIADGNLNISEIKNRSTDEIGVMSNSLNKMLNNLKKMIQQIRNTSERLSASSEELLASGEQVSLAAEQVGSSMETVASGSEEQSAQVEQAAGNVDNMVEKIKIVGEDAKLINQGADNVSNSIFLGKESIENTIKKVNQVNQDTALVSDNIKVLGNTTDEIGKIIDLINGIAAQTNLLALNAAIEAARAGEAGRGFSVVADEIRDLAEESSTATNDIVDLINEIKDNVDQAVKKMNKNVNSVGESVKAINDTKESFNKIDQSNKQLKELVERITNSIQIIINNSQDIDKVIGDVASISQESAENAERVAATSQEQIAATEDIVGSARQLTEIAEELITITNQIQT